MDNNSPTTDEPNSPTTDEPSCPYLVLQGQRVTPFSQFVRNLHGEIMNAKLPKGQTPRSRNKLLALLKPEAQDIFFKVTNMVVDILESGQCFKHLHEDIIVITDFFEVPMLTCANLEPMTAVRLKNNTDALADMIDRVVKQASRLYANNDSVNPDLKDHLQQIRGFRPKDDFFAVRFPVCHCPLVNRGTLMVTMYDFTMDVLRFVDPEAYSHVIAGLIYPLDWELRLQDNANLLKHSKRGSYDPKALKNNTDPRLQLPRLHRNGPAHPYQGTANSNADHGITWSKEEMSHTFYHLCPSLISSMHISLNFMGELRHLKTEHLFAHHIRKKYPGSTSRQMLDES